MLSFSQISQSKKLLDLPSRISSPIGSDKPTVCSITLNSKDEREVFKEHLGSDFNFIELVDPEDKNWFKKACKSQVQCDILIVSGHFGGAFFGPSGKLALEAVENFSCNNTCHGILKSPKEVFLFGCNTMAGKNPDSRSIQEYTDLLFDHYRDAFPTRILAEEVAAYTYSPLGRKTKSRMKRIFQNARIYGFHSQSPFGHDIKPRLNVYLNSIPNYQTHLSQFPMKEENKLWSRSMMHQFIRSENGVALDHNPVCILSSSEPIYKKLNWIYDIFDKGKALIYAPNINEYLFSLEEQFGQDWETWPTEEVSYMEFLQFHEEAKLEMNRFFGEPILGLRSVQFKMLSLGEKLGWYDSAEKVKIQRTLLGDLFLKNLTLEDKNELCSLRTQIDLEIENLPKEKWDEKTVEAIGCIRPSDERIHLRLIEILTNDSDSKMRETTSEALSRIGPSSDRAILALIKALDHNRVEVRKAAAESLNGDFQYPPSEKTQLALIEALIKTIAYDTSRDVRRKAKSSLEDMIASGEKPQLSLIKALGHPLGRVRKTVIQALRKVEPPSEKIQLAFIKAFNNESIAELRVSILRALKVGGHFFTEEVRLETQKTLVNALSKNSRQDVKGAIVVALGKVQSPKEEIQILLIKVLKENVIHEENFYLMETYSSIFFRMKPASQRIQLEIIKTFFQEDFRSKIILGLQHFIMQKVGAAVDNPDDYLRKEKEIIWLLIQVLIDHSMNEEEKLIVLQFFNRFGDFFPKEIKLELETILIETWNDMGNSTELRKQSVKTLTYFHTKKAIEALIKTLYKDPSDKVKLEVIQALLEKVSEKVKIEIQSHFLKIFIDVNNFSAKVRQASIKGLLFPYSKEIREALINTLIQDPSNYVKIEAALALEEIIRHPRENSKEIQVKIETLFLEIFDDIENSNAGLRVASMSALSSNKTLIKKNQKVFIKALAKDPSEEVRRQSIWALERIQPSNKIIQDLTIQALVKDPSEKVRRAVVWALERIQPSNKIIQDLTIQALAKDPSEKVRRAVVWALGRIQPSNKIIQGALIQALAKDPNESVREEVVWVLGRIQPSNKIIQGALIQALAKDPSEEVRRQSIWALERIQPSNKIIQGALIQALAKDPNEEVRRVSVKALKGMAFSNKITQDAFIKAFTKDPSEEVRRASVEALIDSKLSNKEVLGSLVELLAHENQSVRSSAVEILEEFESSGFPYPELLERIKEYNPELHQKLTFW